MPCNPEVLKHVPLFSLLDEEESAVLAGQVECKTFSPRQRIYKMGDTSGRAYVVVSGRVRVSTVDQDHQEIVGFLTAFLKVLDAGRSDQVPGALAAFYQRTTKHFEYEERLMAERGFPGARDHTDAHQSFLKDVKRFAVILAQSGVTESFRQWAHGRLVSWFRFHIKAYDIALGRMLVTREALTPPAADATPQPSEERR